MQSVGISSYAEVFLSATAYFCRARDVQLDSADLGVYVSAVRNSQVDHDEPVCGAFTPPSDSSYLANHSRQAPYRPVFEKPRCLEITHNDGSTQRNWCRRLHLGVSNPASGSLVVRSGVGKPHIYSSIGGPTPVVRLNADVWTSPASGWRMNELEGAR